jgi:O-antigen biosynthesis protein
VALKTFWRRLAKANREAEEGNRARDERDWSSAAAHYRRYLELKPNKAAMWIQLGHSLKESGQFVGALCAYSEARRLSTNDADLELSLGHLYKLMGHLDEAVAHYRRSLEIDGNPNAAGELRSLAVPV